MASGRMAAGRNVSQETYRIIPLVGCDAASGSLSCKEEIRQTFAIYVGRFSAAVRRG